MTRRQKKLTVTLRGEEGSLKGQLIDYLRSHPNGARYLVIETLMSRLGPMLVKNQPELVEKEKSQSHSIVRGYVTNLHKFWEEGQKQLTEMMSSRNSNNKERKPVRNVIP